MLQPLSPSTDMLLSRLKIRHGVNFIPARTLPFIFLCVQLKGCFWQMLSGKRSCLLSASSLHSPLLHSHPSAIKQHSSARSQTESKTKAPTQPPLPFSRNGPLQGSPGSTSRPDRNKQSKQRVSCPSREGLKSVMSFIKMQGRDTSTQPVKSITGAC